MLICLELNSAVVQFGHSMFLNNVAEGCEESKASGQAGTPSNSKHAVEACSQKVLLVSQFG